MSAARSSGGRLDASVEQLAFLFVLLIPLGVPVLPGNLQISDLVFVVLFVVLCLGRRISWGAFSMLDWAVIAYLLASAISTFLSPEKRAAGIELMKQAYLVLVYALFGLLGRRPQAAERLAQGLILPAVVLAVFGLAALGVHRLAGIPIPVILETYQMPFLGEVSRLRGTLHSPNFLANLYTFVVPLALAGCLAARRSSWVWRPWASGGMILASLATLSHGIVGLAGGALAVTWRSLGSRGIGARVLGITGVLILGAAVTFITTVSIRKVSVVFDSDPFLKPPAYVYAMPTSEGGVPRVTVQLSYHWMSYGLLKRIAYSAFLKNPLFGAGLGRFPDLSEKAYHEGAIHARYRGMDPHSTWLGRLAETGLLGGLTLFALWVTVLRSGWAPIQFGSPDAWLAGGLLAGLIGVLLNSVHTDVMNFRFLWVGFGLLRGLKHSAPR